MKCEKTDEYGCKKDCEFWIIRQAEPNKYFCMTVPHGLYGENTILVEKGEWDRIMSMPKHKIDKDFMVPHNKH